MSISIPPLSNSNSLAVSSTNAGSFCFEINFTSSLCFQCRCMFSITPSKTPRIPVDHHFTFSQEVLNILYISMKQLQLTKWQVWLHSKSHFSKHNSFLVSNRFLILRRTNREPGFSYFSQLFRCLGIFGLGL